MSLIDNILMALQNLKANKMRTFLTMLGIIIGISAVIAIETVGSSLSGSISNSLSSFGIANISVSVTSKDSSNDAFARMFSRNSYKESDLISNELIEEYKEVYGNEINYIELTENVGTITYSVKDTSAKISLMGVNGDYLYAEDIEMLTGRFVNDEDGLEKNNYIVVSDQFLSDMGMSKITAVGEILPLTINNHLQEFTIIGIYKYDSETSMSFTSSTSVTTSAYIPVGTAKYLTHANDGYSSLTIISSADVDTTKLLEDTQYFFESAYAMNDSYTVNCSNMEAMLETVTSMMSTLTLAISAIAGISLIVGGVGVMNIMLVSITERTKEIGTRKALGATRNNIRMQFIVEAIIVCIIGGFIGIVLGLIIGAVGAKLIGFDAIPSVTSVVVAVVFSIGIGVFFGYYPANKAAKLNPIDALRYE